MKPKRTLIGILLAALLPQPLLAYESGVNAMDAVNELETQTLQAWVYNEIRDMETGFRVMLEPILPPVESNFNTIDSEIANFMAQGQMEQMRLIQLIESEGEALEVSQIEYLNTPISSTITLPDTDVFFYGTPNGEVKLLPDVTMTEEGRFKLDTSKGIDLPDVTFDPRDGGIYESEIPIVQAVFDKVDQLQDAVPAPIQTTGTDIYNQIIGYKPDA